MLNAVTDIALDRREFLTASLSSCVAPLVPACGSEDVDGRQADAQGPPNFPPVPEDALRYGAARRGIRFGAAVRADTVRHQRAQAGFFLAECSSITPEWSMKWESLAYSGPKYDFADCDLIVDFARRNGLAVRGHTLLWHLATPGWAQERIRDTGDWGIVENHIRQVVSRYGSAVDQWDVVNEPIDANGTGGLRENIFYEAFGSDYIEKAIRLTHEVSPGTRTFINDYSLEHDFPEEMDRRRSLIHLAERLLERDVPLSGIGVQAHLDLRKGPISESDIHAFFRAIEDLGLEIAVTELDVREQDFALPAEQRDMLVSDAVRRYLEIALQYACVTSVTTWGLSDAHSWLAETSVGHPANRGLPYDELWQSKPMRTAIVEMMV